MSQLFSQLIQLLESAGVNDRFLYHTLDSYKALKILKTNELILPLSDTNSSEVNPLHKKRKTYYLSLARTPSSGYIADRAKGNFKVHESILFVFDKDLLKNIRGVRFSPVEYYGYDEDGRRYGNAKEAEDRMFSDSHKISNILSAIKEIRLYMSIRQKRDILSQTTTEIADPRRGDYDVYSFCKKNRIPITLYSANNFAGYLLGKPKPKDQRFVHEALLANSKNHTASDYREHNRAKTNERRFGKDRRRFPYDVLDMVMKTSIDKLTYEERNTLRTCLKYGVSSNKGYVTGAEALLYEYRSDIHNIRGENSDRNKRVLDRCLKLAKAKSMRELFEFVANKWKDKVSDR